ncbi:MAG: hypothetical protein ACRBK7_07020 [Acidimicrobiales bacterium]
MLFSVVVVGGLALFLASTAWLQRSTVAAIELGPLGPYRVHSSAGPVEVTLASSEAQAVTWSSGFGVASGVRPSATLRYDASWLLFGPSASLNRSAADPEGVGGRFGVGGDRSVDIACDTRFPCRASSRLEVPLEASPVEVAIHSDDGDVSVGSFDGQLAISTAGSSGVFLGPVAGEITVTTENGDVFGYGLAATEVEVETIDGAIELDFAVRPRRLVVRSDGEAVTIRLPDGNYAVSVEGGSSTAINVGQVASADSHIRVEARGAVRIDPKR